MASLGLARFSPHRHRRRRFPARLAQPHWGRGLATEAAHVALRDVFERIGLDRIISIARPVNIASIRIMEKLGLKLECNFEKDGTHLVRYAISRPPN